MKENKRDRMCDYGKQSEDDKESCYRRRGHKNENLRCIKKDEKVKTPLFRQCNWGVLFDFGMMKFFGILIDKKVEQN